MFLPATARIGVCRGVHENVLGLRYFDMALQRTSGGWGGWLDGWMDGWLTGWVGGWLGGCCRDGGMESGMEGALPFSLGLLLIPQYAPPTHPS
jgi:hypothetical protein